MSSFITSLNDFSMHVLVTVMDYDLTNLEFAAVTTSLIGVWLGTTGKRITWPWWAISSLLYAWLFYNWELYSSALLQFVFIAAAVVGWFGWGPQGAQSHPLRARQALGTVAVGIVAWIVLAPALGSIGAAATWPDSFGLVFSVVAQILMIKAYRENWIVWFIVDAVYTIEYFTQDLRFTSLLYLLFTGIALRGLVAWKNSEA